MKRKVHHLISIHSGGIFSMGCKRFYDQRKCSGFRHCSHIEMVDCKACINHYKKRIENRIEKKETK